jgi:hypothetical protein
VFLQAYTTETIAQGISRESVHPPPDLIFRCDASANNVPTVNMSMSIGGVWLSKRERGPKSDNSAQSTAEQHGDWICGGKEVILGVLKTVM